MNRTALIEVAGIPDVDKLLDDIATRYPWVGAIVIADDGLHIFESQADADAFIFTIKVERNGATLH